LAKNSKSVRLALWLQLSKGDTGSRRNSRNIRTVAATEWRGYR